MKRTRRTQTVAIVLATIVTAAMLSGCVYRRETVPAAAAPAAAPSAVIVAPPANERVVTYPEGRYELRGDGTAQSPYVWVWIPTGATPPNPPPLPRTR